MLRGTANYKIGDTHAFMINGIATPAKIISKPYKKLELEIDGVKKIFDWNELSPIDKNLRHKIKKEIAAKSIVQKPSTLKVVGVAKELPKEVVEKLNPANNPMPQTPSEKLVTPTLYVEKMLNDDNPVDHEYVARCIKHDLRIILQKKGYKVDKSMSFVKLLGMIDGYLPHAK